MATQSVVTMAGSLTLKTQKSRLTRHCNNLSDLCMRCEEDISFQNLSLSSDSDVFERMASLTHELKASAKLLSEHLSAFISTVEGLNEPLNEEQEGQVLDYMEKTQSAIDRAENLVIRMEAKRLSVLDSKRESEMRNERTQVLSIGQLEMKTPKLPAIPIPTFDGKIWEYDNFWTLFYANVDAQNSLTKLQKFNYLLSALQGEPRELVRRYPITGDNYDSAVNLLHKKYGNSADLVRVLHKRLENANTDKSSIQAQRKLLEFIIPVVTQLQKLGANLDGSYNTQKVLSKFAYRIQRKVLEVLMTHDMPEEAWKMQDMIEALDAHIGTEERINSMVKIDMGKESERGEGSKRRPTKPHNHSNCIFCDSTEHRAAGCSRYSTIAERRNFLQENKMCLNCGRKGHFASQCSKEGCRLCQGTKHFYALCPQRQSIDNPIKSEMKSTIMQPTQPSSKKPSVRAQLNTNTKNKRNTETSKVTQAHPIRLCAAEENIQEEEGQEIKGNSYHSFMPHSTMQKENIVLLTGIAHLWNAKSQKWQPVEILFDTGADQSFISQDLTEELGLQCKEMQELNMYTFGDKKPKAISCGVTTVGLLDSNGEKHNIRLYATPVLTAKGKMTQLSQEDKNFMMHNNICLSTIVTGGPTKPQILLGCDQLWNLLESPSPHYILPSGLRVIPSKLGYLLTGTQQVTQCQEFQEYDVQSSMVTMIQAMTDDETDRQRWDKYWTMDSAGIYEFSGTKNAEKSAINENVLKFFNNTIEKKEDGYYVRLPFKENHPPLPTNKAIAQKRLQSVTTNLKAHPQLLADYDNTIKTQLRSGIIEELPQHNQKETGIIHYIPHQPVITPHKETTKLRIVFDASSHFKGHPSLNDVLHQGPLILPDIYAVLLRFRASNIVVTSDVEKAFLQVRLHECDRDATRFFWLRDCNKEPSAENVITYRFTRVTFGLNASPFLLSATIQHHLQKVSDTNLGNEIQENLYVDNLILSADTKNEAIRKSTITRKIFADMGMNLREFLSNDESIITALPQDALANSTTQKILGVKWNSTNDTLTIRCDFPKSPNLTKRIVARQISSIYDPFGLMVPLLTQLKRFQQELWKRKYAWDTTLPTQIQEKWNKLVSDADGFEKSLPRKFANEINTCSLALFADASTLAMSACAYLFDEKEVTLLMAKCKLPSLNSNPTIPKMEMNAITIAVRLGNSIYQALESKRTEKNFQIHVFSDSQIALSWLTSPINNTNAGVLVTNRLKEIRNIVKTLKGKSVSVHFHFVQTTENPADAGTRGLTRTQLSDHMWWEGPKFLRLPCHTWSGPTYELQLDELENEIPSINVINTKKADQETVITSVLDLKRFSPFEKAKRAMALTLLFLKKLLKQFSHDRQKAIFKSIRELQNFSDSLCSIGGSDITAARYALIRNHQAVHNTTNFRKSVENTLRLFKDDRGLWCSKGRIGNSSLNEEAKYPIFIHPKTPLATLIIKDTHGLYHLGIEHTIATVRSKYWIPKLRQQVRQIVKACVKCRRFNGLSYTYPEMTDLPSRRVNRHHVFQHIGVDLFELPTTTDGEERLKPYGCIFTCTVTRLIHLELVKNATVGEFLHALRRFIARRGVPSSITSDNAPSFLLCAEILNAKMHEKHMHREILDLISEKEIQWYQITPYAPWQGGFYERLIKSIKHALYKAMRARPTKSSDDLTTTLCEIEACLNSRPLTYQSSEQDFSSIRPVDFIQRDLNLSFPYDSTEQTSVNDSDTIRSNKTPTLRTRKDAEDALRSSCEITDRFWNIWQEHYLTSLRETHRKFISKQRHNKLEPKVGAVVLVSDPLIPRNAWKLARITNLHPGKDGQVREVELTTATKRKIRRPVNLIVPLELDDATADTNDNKQEMNTQDGERKFYDLRPRKPVHHVENVTTNFAKSAPKISRKWFLFHVMILTLIITVFQTNAQGVKWMYTKNRTQLFTETNTSVSDYALRHNDLKLGTVTYITTFLPEVMRSLYKVSLGINSHFTLKTIYSNAILCKTKESSLYISCCAHLDKINIHGSALAKDAKIAQARDEILLDILRKHINIIWVLSGCPNAIHLTPYALNNKSLHSGIVFVWASPFPMKYLLQRMDRYNAEVQQKYKRLVHALPPLPSPTRLYKKIVNCCRHLHKTTRNMPTLMERIKNLWKSQEDWKEKLVELQLIETLTEKKLLEFKLIRTELRTLFAVPPLLIATDIISENNWKAIISQTQFDEEENSILTKHETIETVIEDQMEILHEQQSILNDYRRMLQEEEHKATRTFQTTVLASLDHLKESLEQGLHSEKNDSGPKADTLMDIKEEITNLLQKCLQRNANALSDDQIEHWAGEGNDGRYKSELPSRDGDDEMYSETESERIRRNAEYMEGVQDMTEDEWEKDSITTHNKLWKERIWNDLEEAEREVKKMENIVYELDMEPTCNPRDYRKGIIQREDERGMVCTFCGKVGEHYSDSCEAYPSSKERLKIVEAEGRCKFCLMGHNCKKKGLRCFHCNEYGHHSALCELPEKSEYIRRRIKEAIERRKNAKERIKELYRQLDEIQ